MTDFWRKGAGIAAATAAVVALLLLAAYVVDPSGMRVALGITPELDVPYVESRSETVDAMLEMAAVDDSDYVIDLGTGDGRILLAAARERGAAGLGVDIDPVLVAGANSAAERQGVSDRVTFREQDLFATDLQDASVVTMFLLPEVNLRLRPRLLEQLRPGARVVSNRFHMGEWQADETRRVAGYPVYLWVVPAQVAGTWRLEHGGKVIELELEQSFQQVSGTALVDGAPQAPEFDLRGDSLRFDLDLGDGPVLFDALVRDNRMLPVGGGDWQAVREAG